MKKLILIIVVILTSLNVNSQSIQATIFHNGVPTITDLGACANFKSDWLPTNPTATKPSAIESQPITISRHDSVQLHFTLYGTPAPVLNNYYIFIGNTMITKNTTNNLKTVSYTDTNSVYLSHVYIVIVYQNESYILRINISDPNVNTSGLAENGFDESKLSVFPNPSRDIINIKFHANDTDQPVHIFNLAGQLVYENHDTRQREQTHLEVNVSHFSGGMYLIRTGNEMNSEVTKFVKIN